jgi:hypothetical protein
MKTVSWLVFSRKRRIVFRDAMSVQVPEINKVWVAKLREGLLGYYQGIFAGEVYSLSKCD